MEEDLNIDTIGIGVEDGKVVVVIGPLKAYLSYNGAADVALAIFKHSCSLAAKSGGVEGVNSLISRIQRGGFTEWN